MAPPQEELPLKAIIFADACGGRPSPTRAAAAAQALPLHGSPLLHYQLHAVATTGVAEALVLSSAPLSLPPALHNTRITTLSNPTWRSHGDALRDVESRQALRPAHDFLLVQPGALFNVHAGALARAHAARAAADRNWLVSLVFRRAAAGAPLAVATQAATGALCMYRRGSGAAAAAVELDTAAENVGLRGGGGVEVSVDVVDVGLDVCSPDLLVEFRENFDFDEVRDYVRAKLDGGEAELLGNRMFAHFVDTAAGEFAACVDGWAGYCRASRDVRDGWLEPVLPARVARIAGRVGRAVGKGILVLGDGSVELDATADVVECTLGSGVVVETGGRVVRSVVGDGCRIGAGAVVEDCIVGAGVVVEAAAKVSAGLLLDGVFLASEVCIPAYCFLGTNVRVGRGGGAEAGMKPGTWVGEAPRAGQREAGEEGDGTKTESESDESLSNDGDNGYVGSGGGAVSSEMLGDDGSGKLLPNRRRCQYYLEQSGVKRGHIFAGWPGFLEDCQSDSEDELEGKAGEEMEGSADDSAGNFDDSEEHWEGRKMAKFYAEIVETVEHGISEAADVDTIALEVNSLKLGYELMYYHARIGVVRALAAMVQKHNVGTSPKVLFAAVKAIFARWSELVSKFSSGDNAVTQRSLVDELAAFLADNGLLLQYVLRTLYDRDILEEDAILGWANTERRAAMDRPLPQVLKQVLPFIEWLEEADEEDESDDEKDFASLCVKSE